MSYVRFGPESDIYIYGSGKGLECIIANDAVTDGVTSYFFKYEDDAHFKMLGLLEFLDHLGLKVPQHPKDRLLKELSSKLPLKRVDVAPEPQFVPQEFFDELDAICPHDAAPFDIDFDEGEDLQ